MKKILCYGDSNTFGYNPLNGKRYDSSLRWTGILKESLKNNFTLVENGVNNRTGFVFNPQGELFSSQLHFPKLINVIGEVEFLILSIGTNDLQFLYDVTPDDIVCGLSRLIEIAHKTCKNIILIPPVIMEKSVTKGAFSFQFDLSSIEKSKEANKIYRKIADEYNIYLLDFNEFVCPSLADGLHYESASHKIIADKISEFILNLA